MFLFSPWNDAPQSTSKWCWCDVAGMCCCKLWWSQIDPSGMRFQRYHIPAISSLCWRQRGGCSFRIPSSKHESLLWVLQLVKIDLRMIWDDLSCLTWWMCHGISSAKCYYFFFKLLQESIVIMWSSFDSSDFHIHLIPQKSIDVDEVPF